MTNDTLLMFLKYIKLLEHLRPLGGKCYVTYILSCFYDTHNFLWFHNNPTCYIVTSYFDIVIVLDKICWSIEVSTWLICSFFLAEPFEYLNSE